ncbi:hypothetical protein [Nocardia niigatensis]
MSIIATLNRKAALAALDAIDSGDPNPTLTLTAREAADLLNAVAARPASGARATAPIAAEFDTETASLRAATGYALDVLTRLADLLHPDHAQPGAVVDLAALLAHEARETLTSLTSEYL